MSTNWIAPTLNDLAKVISIDVLKQANQNIDPDSITAILSGGNNVQPSYDPNVEDRATDLLALAVQQFRGAIRVCGKQPLSVTAGTVPPECFRHVLYIAAHALVSSTPNLQAMLMLERNDTPFTLNFKRADEYLELVTKGRVVTPPTDPTGRDYVNVVNVPWSTGVPVTVQMCDSNGNLVDVLVDSPYPAFDPTKVLNLPVCPVRYGGKDIQDLTTYDSIWTSQNFPFPVGGIGQP